MHHVFNYSGDFIIPTMATTTTASKYIYVKLLLFFIINCAWVSLLWSPGWLRARRYDYYMHNYAALCPVVSKKHIATYDFFFCIFWPQNTTHANNVGSCKGLCQVMNKTEMQKKTNANFMKQRIHQNTAQATTTK